MCLDVSISKETLENFIKTLKSAQEQLAVKIPRVTILAPVKVPLKDRDVLELSKEDAVRGNPELDTSSSTSYCVSKLGRGSAIGVGTLPTVAYQLGGALER